VFQILLYITKEKDVGELSLEQGVKQLAGERLHRENPTREWFHWGGLGGQ
jgi:hypothetical protein